MSTTTDSGFKKTAIDWLLAHGTCDSMGMDTPTALFRLADRGVDYDASEMPEFNRVAVEPGDSFADPIYDEAFSATVWPVGSVDRHDRFTFVIAPTEMRGILMSAVIRGVITAGEAGDGDWKARFPEARVRHEHAQIERAAQQAGYAAARLVKEAGGDKAAQIAAATTARDEHRTTAMAAWNRAHA